MNKYYNRAQVERNVMPNVVGYVTYDVKTSCPHCGKTIQLNQYPYNDDSTKYSKAEDELGLAIFGTKTDPAKLDNFSVQYTCCDCQKQFCLTSLDI